MLIQSNADLLAAFPSSIRTEANAVIAALPESPHPSETFSVRVAGEVVSIPHRIYQDPLAISVGNRLGSASETQKEILSCLFTRHADGLVREEHLRRIVRSKKVWIPPFVIQLAGEYVVEILHIIAETLHDADRTLYGHFVRDNPQFIGRTKQRIASYWDRFYRSFPREKYPGFRIQTFLEELEQKGPASAGPR